MMRLVLVVIVLASCADKTRAKPPGMAAPPRPTAAAEAGVGPSPAETPDAGAVTPAAIDEKPAIAEAERAAYERARPIFETHCARCHSVRGAKASKKKLGHFSLDTYPFGGHHAATIGETVREVLGVTGHEPTMPMGKEGSVRGADLDAIVAWSRAFDAAKAAGLHGEPDVRHDHEPHHH